MMANSTVIKKYRRYLPSLPDYVPGTPPLRTPVLIPVLRGNAHRKVTDCLRDAAGIMRVVGVDEWGPNHDYVLWWQALGRNRNRWTEPLRLVWEKRTAAVKLVASALEDQLPDFQGLSGLFRYEPSYNRLRKNIGAQVYKGVARVGDPSFRSPLRLVHNMIHEGRHLWQERSWGDNIFEPPRVVREADACLFTLEHRNLSGIIGIRLLANVTRFKRYCDINDRLSAGLPVEAKYTRPIEHGGWGINQAMNPVKRAELELRYSFIESNLRRDLGASEFSAWWSTVPRTFSYEAMRPLPRGPERSRLRDLWRFTTW